MLYLSIDVEASGPFPGTHSLVSIGAVPVVRTATEWELDRTRTFYVELQPMEGAAEDPEATAIHGLSTEYLRQHGLPPREAMERFRDYVLPLGELRTAAWPISFDHPYVGWYAQRFLGSNPVGHTGFDIPSFAMGLFHCTSREPLRQRLLAAGFVAAVNPHKHHALEDALEQGHTLAWLLNRAEQLER
ncbi:MAG: exonuclease domain-containing protein [Myxococcota bacterium]